METDHLLLYEDMNRLPTPLETDANLKYLEGLSTATATAAEAAALAANLAKTGAEQAQADADQSRADAATSAAQALAAKNLAVTKANEALETVDGLNGIRPDLASTAAGKGAAMVGGLIADPITLNVPAQHATIQAAFAYLADKTIARGATVTIKVADGTYVLAGSINANHPQGSQIQVIGNTTTPGNCVLMGPNPPTFDAFVCSNGHVLGMLDGFLVDLPSKALLANNFTAVLAVNGAQINCGTKMKTRNWYYGIAARNGAFINAPSANVDAAGDVGIWAFVGSTIYAQNAVVTNVADSANGFGYGLQAEYGSTLDCSGASASGCLVGGIASLSNSNVRALNATASSNTGSGFFARDGGTIENHNSTANSNGRYGVEEIGHSRVLGNSLTLNSNTLGTIKPIATLDNSSLGARIAPNTGGPLRIDTIDSSPTYFNTGGGLQAEVRDQPTATSRVYQQGGNAANGDQPTVGVDGAASNVSMRYQAKGAGSHFMRTGGGLQLSVFDTTNAVNYIGATGAAAGGSPRFQAFGTDTNIHMRYTPKGTGSHIFDGLQNFANDAAAAAGGVPVGALYRNGSVLMTRVA